MLIELPWSINIFMTVKFLIFTIMTLRSSWVKCMPLKSKSVNMMGDNLHLTSRGECYCIDNLNNLEMFFPNECKQPSSCKAFKDYVDDASQRRVLRLSISII